MSIQQTKIQSDLEKRLKLLRQQVYGKSSNEIRPNQISSALDATNDLTYLYQDLLKISLFASLAIGAQVIIYFLLQNHILKFNLF